MRAVADAGVAQVVLPPQSRPGSVAMARVGLDLAQPQGDAAERFLLSACTSSASMWSANSATFTPSVDAEDARPHLTPANLVSSLHRALETPHTARLLAAAFPEPTFVHHDPLPAALQLRDEGAANHACLCGPDRGAGVHLFVFGAYGLPATQGAEPQSLLARQTYEASRTVARVHRLPPERLVFARQSAGALHAGAFHNDLVMTSNEHVLLYHERAWVDGDAVVEELRAKYRLLNDDELCSVRVPEALLSLEEALATYVFNSQIVTRRDGSMTVLAPEEAAASPAARATLALLTATPQSRVDEVRYVGLSESMRNGGGPACLRLRMALTAAEADAVHPGLRFGDRLHRALGAWIERHYRDTLTVEDLADPGLWAEGAAAFAELEAILGFPCGSA
jgi:succinylarginine dihydrolase